MSIPVRINPGGGNGFPTVCNVTRLAAWKTTTYQGPLARVSTFWIYQTQPQIRLTQELATALALGDCNKKFSNLYAFKAGRNGPVDIQNSFKVMCSETCLESDSLHQAMMEYTGCGCLELSTQIGHPLYKAPGDFCDQNTGRLLCSLIGYCGIWDCRIGDFMCPRYEFDKKIIPLKNKFGNCEKVSSAKKNNVSMMTVITVILTIIFILMS
jgi:hypothetical protein|mmetsp:Transcript_16594/g.15940  ORF Transcript_16594/g.15940 Transcript_16594/m.15940 type:complete len:211 (+) Transcript_16594:205-837(+)